MLFDTLSAGVGSFWRVPSVWTGGQHRWPAQGGNHPTFTPFRKIALLSCHLRVSHASYCSSSSLQGFTNDDFNDSQLGDVDGPRM